MIPSFAVVGRSNKGKSSLVATLTENDRIPIAPTPRTTEKSQAYTFEVDGRALFKVFDTPGFEDAPAILEWLKSKAVSAHERRARIEEFYREFHGSDEFRFECELLKPILDGATILYVADAGHEYRPNFEAEFEILQWTGQPSMALLNQIGESDFKAEWKRALGQYFRKVREFDAQSPWLRDRVALIEELAFLNDDMQPQLREAARTILRQQDRRFREAAEIIAGVILESLRFEMKVDADRATSDSHLLEEFFNALRDIEMRGRERLLALFGFSQLRQESGPSERPESSDDLFSKEQWEILGLTRSQLMTAGAAAGAFAGGTIDVMVGGASFMVGTGIGGLAGAVSSAYLAFSDPKIAGLNLKKRVRTMGPYKNLNFPWILLDRQVDFVGALATRSHARRGVLEWSDRSGKKGFSSQLKTWQIHKMNLHFQNIRWNLAPEASREALANEIASLWIPDKKKNGEGREPTC